MVSGRSPCDDLGAVHRNVPPRRPQARDISAALLKASQTRYRLSGRHHTVTDLGNRRPHSPAMSNRINLRDWRSRAASSSIVASPAASLEPSNGQKSEGWAIFQNPADVEFGDGFPRDVAGNNLGVDVRLPAIAKDKQVARLVVEDLEFLGWHLEKRPFAFWGISVASGDESRSSRSRSPHDVQVILTALHC